MNKEDFELPEGFEEEFQDKEAPEPEVLYGNFRQLLDLGQKKSETRKNPLPQILSDCLKFLLDKPEPPASWAERLGERAKLYDYHQIVLPDGLCDPYAEEVTNMKDLISNYSTDSFMALEHFILSRNHFLMSDGHLGAYDCPEPLLMLESHPEDQDVSWDCFCYVFPDGSYQVYNLEKEEEESLGRGAQEMFELYQKILTQLVIRVPQEGVDYGDLRRSD
tara:strand:- start:114 stop:773 length:660 start_codon:yes stop_codon:yes gene_type:complete